MIPHRWWRWSRPGRWRGAKAPISRSRSSAGWIASSTGGPASFLRCWPRSGRRSPLRSVGPTVDPSFDPRVRAVAGDALRELNDYESADVAAEVLETAVDRDLIANSLGLLAHLGRGEHLPAIRRHLTASEPIIRARAVAALGNVGAPADHPAMTAALADPSPWVALRAAEALRDARALPSVGELDLASHPRAELVRQLLAGHQA